MIRIVKRSKKSSWPSWGRQPKILYYSSKHYLPTMIFASWLGTYLDLILVNNDLYSFPVRPFADIFPFSIFFTLFVLPIMTVVIVHVLHSMSSLHKILTVLILAFIMTFVEIFSEKIGLFVHSADWRHYYTFFGYLVYMWLVFRFHRLIYS